MIRSTHPALGYICALYAQEDALLAEIRANLEAQRIDWQVGAEEGRLLQLLVRLHGAKRIVEVGTLAAYSAIWMARALPEGGKLYGINKDPAHHALAQKFVAKSEVAQRIELLLGDANDLLPTLNTQRPFDLLFIDADKNSYNAYLDWGEQHIRKGGLIVADNTLLFGAVLQDAPPEGTAPSTWAAMRRFNERLADPVRYDAVMLPTGQGLSVAVKKF